MLKMGTVWDRTAEVINGRTASLAWIAGLTLWLPGVLRDVLVYATVGGAAPAAVPTGGTLTLLFIVSLIIGVVTIWGTLALIAVASDPATTRDEGLRIAARRLPLAIGLALLLGLVIFVLLVPAVAPIAAAVPNPAAMTGEGMTTAMAGISAGTRAFVGLYLLAFGVLLIWLTARLAVLNPVVVNERIGVGSFARSFALTRGLTWKIVGLALLFLIVAAVVVLATRSVVGIVLRLILGGDNLSLVALLTAAVVAAVTAGLTIVWTCFVAQLYVAAREAPRAA